VLEAAADAPPRGPEGAAGAADEAERDPQALGPGHAEHGLTGGGGIGVGRPLDRRHGGCVDGQHGQVAVAVDPDDLALGLAAVGEGDLGGAVAEVVGAGQDVAGGDDDARASAVATDGDGGGVEALGDGGNGLLQLVECGHGGPP
jgi:hypothetical protein